MEDLHLCNFFLYFFFFLGGGGGGGGLGGRWSKPLAQAVVTKVKLCKLNWTFTSL